MDAPFNQTGIAIVGDLNTRVYAQEIALQDDKILVLSRAFSGADGLQITTSLNRYNLNGSADLTFHGGNMVQLNWGYSAPGSEKLEQLVVLENGGIILGGTTNVDGHLKYSGLLVKLDKNGFIDPSFGEDGRLATMYQHGFSVTPDDKIVVRHSRSLSRFNSNGSIDTDVWKLWCCYWC